MSGTDAGGDPRAHASSANKTMGCDRHHDADRIGGIPRHTGRQGPSGSARANVNLFTTDSLPVSLVGPLASLLDDWRARATWHDHHGLKESGTLIGRLADDLEVALSQRDERLVPIAVASLLTGYSGDHLRRQIRSGKLARATSCGRIMVRMGDLRSKAALAHPAQITQLHGTSRQQVARSYLKKED